MNILKSLDNKLLKQLATVMLAAFLLAAGGYLYVTRELPKNVEQAQKSSQMAALLVPLAGPVQLDPPTKTADCVIAGSLPDHECSPGAIFETATKEIVCVPGYTKTVRNVSTKTRKTIFAEYGIAWPQPYGSYEVDHLIPLALGGSNEIANLFPEARAPQPGFQEKDVVENYLHEHVCSGEINLAAAQVQIANNWLNVYNNLSQEVIKDYKTRYKSWAGSN